MPLRHEEMVLHKSRSGTGTWRGEGQGQNGIVLHGTGRQTYVCMKCDKVFKIQEKFDETNPMIMCVTRRTQAELTLYGESNVLLIKF